MEAAATGQCPEGPLWPQTDRQEPAQGLGAQLRTLMEDGESGTVPESRGSPRE